MEHSFLVHRVERLHGVILVAGLAEDLVAGLVEVFGRAAGHNDGALGPRHLHLLVHAWEQSVEIYVTLHYDEFLVNFVKVTFTDVALVHLDKFVYVVLVGIACDVSFSLDRLRTAITLSLLLSTSMLTSSSRVNHLSVDHICLIFYLTKIFSFILL